MYRSQTTTYVITMIALFFCCVLIAAGQSTDTEDPTKDSQSSSEENPAEKVSSELKDNLPAPKGIFTRIKDKIASFTPSDEHSKNQRAFDFSTNGDDKIRYFSFFSEVPLKFKSYEVSISGKYNQTFQKKDPSSEMQHPPEKDLSSEMQDPSESELQKKWMFLSESYALGLEGSSTHKFFRFFTLGGQIDYENGITTEIDPHVHVDIFTQFPLFPKWNFIEGGAGIWVAGQELSTNSAKFHSGWHFHIDINSKYFNMMIEALPRWNFGEFRVIVSPELVIKFKPFGKKFAFVIHGEIEYYHNKSGLTLEPVFDINPWEIRWTQLIRVPF